MKLSIIIPTFNASKTIERAINSALLPLKEFGGELIVVDDRSNDDTVEIVKKRFPFLRVLSTKSNGGPGHARNLGVQTALGDWILFLDADDELEPESLRSIFGKVFNQVLQPDLIAFDFIQKDEMTKEINYGISRNDLQLLSSSDNIGNLLKQFLLNRIDPSVIFYIFRKEFINKNNIKFRKGLHEDVDYIFNIFAHNPKIEVIADKPYVKWNTQGSIVNTIGVKHIDGYFGAIDAIANKLKEIGMWDIYSEEFREGVVNITSSRIIRILRERVSQEDDPIIILEAIFKRIKALNINPYIPRAGKLKTKYEIIFSEFVNAFINATPIDHFMLKIKALEKKSWSCYDLHNSIFFAPDQIRTCCKRYFYKGALKGDVVLLQGIEEGMKYSYTEIKHAKEKLHFEINRNNADDCSGCPFLSFRDWGEPLLNGIKYLSLEYHSICNMKCTYCDDTYYGGKKPHYDIVSAVDSLCKSGSLNECEYIVWGGGEPVIEKNFSDILIRLSLNAPHVKQRVITNCTVYSNSLATILSEDKGFIVTSIDAGTEITFQKIRKYKDFSRVLKNLKKYADSSPSNIIIKYIILPENKSIEEINSFVSLMKNLELEGCNFQLSCDFKSETLLKDEIIELVRLHKLLTDIGVSFQFLDDLVWQRLPNFSREEFLNIHTVLSSEGLSSCISRPDPEQELIVWGTGAQAEILLKKSWFLKNSNISCFIDTRNEMIGTNFHGIPVYSPEILKIKNGDILIAAVQSAPFIFRQGIEMGIPQKRFIKKFII